MPALTIEGLVLKRRDFGEADRILTVLTDRFGKISVYAKGVRKISSRRAGNIELLNRVKMHLFKAKNYTLTEAEVKETFQPLKSNLLLSTTAFHIIEIVDRLVPENQKNTALYNLVVAILQILEKTPRQIFVRAFEIKLLSMLGFWSTDAVGDVGGEIKNILEDLEYKNWQEIEVMHIKKEQALVLERIMRYYCEKILEAPLKTMNMLKMLKT